MAAAPRFSERELLPQAIADRRPRVHVAAHTRGTGKLERFLLADEHTMAGRRELHTAHLRLGARRGLRAIGDTAATIRARVADRSVSTVRSDTEARNARAIAVLRISATLECVNRLAIDCRRSPGALPSLPRMLASA